MIAWFATKGTGTNEAQRAACLLEFAGGQVELPFDKADKRGSLLRLRREILQLRPRLLFMEGSGLAGGLICLWAKFRLGIPYVVSSGDAIAPFVASHSPPAGWIFALYEWLLCRNCAGFIGWTPYLAGRALTLGAPRAITAAGWSIGAPMPAPDARARIRARYGIPPGHLVFGLVGSMNWNPAKSYAYGLELVEALRRVRRKDVTVLVVGGGSGLEELRRRARDLDATRVILPGEIPLAEVLDHLAAMDCGSLPQSLDGVGMFRYTTKVSEYAAAQLPFVTGPIPMAYDLCAAWCHRLPARNPWEPAYFDALAAWIDSVQPATLAALRAEIPATLPEFDRAAQCQRVAAFLREL